MNRNRLITCLFGLMLLFACESEQESYLIKSYGTLIDMSSIDQCGFVIELEQGGILVPENYPEDFTPQSGQTVYVVYEILENYASECNAGPIIRIESIEIASCGSIDVIGIDDIDKLPMDALSIEEARIDGDELLLKLHYSGGCEQHNIKLVLMPIFCGTPPIPPPTLMIYHNANDDPCDALITKEYCFSLLSLQNPNTPSITFFLQSGFDNGTSYTKTFIYHYK